MPVDSVSDGACSCPDEPPDVVVEPGEPEGSAVDGACDEVVLVAGVGELEAAPEGCDEACGEGDSEGFSDVGTDKQAIM